MKHILTKTILWCALMLGGGLTQAQVVIVSVSNHREDIDENDLTVPLEAGYDLEPMVETSASFNKLDVLNMAKSKDWKVTVSRRDINWAAALTVSVKRNSTGTPCSGCAGVNTGLSPSTYIPLSLGEQNFIYGTGEVSGIDIQMRIQGLSLTIDADTYATEIIYTLYGD